jgi:hypothetical protein
LHCDSDRDQRWVLEALSAVPSPDGVNFVEGIITDVAPRKYAEQALMEKEHIDRHA